jgi:NAD(P)-dependent dehydrogenase (short-subunit alcohol dehydrogenase family)
MPTVLITGASRGIGLELARQYTARGWQVLATCRSPETASSLQQLAEGPNPPTIHQLDVTDPASISALAAALRGTPIDVLLNNAGIGGGRPAALGALDYARWQLVMETNLYGPVRTIEAFLPHVEASEQRKIIAISSSLGSTSTTTGGNYLYRTSKAALNMALRSIARDLASRGVLVALLSPGIVDTDFTRGAQMPKISPETSASGLIATIEALTEADAGNFLRHNGQTVAW